MMRQVLKLDESLAEQRKVWRFYVDQSGDDVVKWRNLANQARQAVKFGGGDKQAWRYTVLASAAPNEEILAGIQTMAQEDTVYSPDLEAAIEIRMDQLLDQGVSEHFPTPGEMVNII